LHDAALFIQYSLVDSFQHVTHAVRLEEQHSVERAFGHCLEIVCAVKPCGAIQVCRADAINQLNVFTG